MNACQVRGYRELLLEEIAFEGLDGVTLDALWKRLDVNNEWALKPIDNLVEEFVWKHLISLSAVNWYVLQTPRECPIIYSSLEEYMDAINKNLADPPTINIKSYPYFEVQDGETMGSCIEYKTRKNVTNEIINLTLSDVKEKWGNSLVVVADQSVRCSVLMSGKMLVWNTLDITTYCILEKIGRARTCGELSSSLNFIKNGANPTFYFWNKLRKNKLITSQNISVKYTYSTLLFLNKFHKPVGKWGTSTLTAIIDHIEASPKKACTLVELKEMNPRISKLIKKPDIQNYLQIMKVPSSQFYSENSISPQKSKTGNERIVTIVKVAENTGQQHRIYDEDGSEEEDEDLVGILEERRLFNKPLLSQCYFIVNQAGGAGISQGSITSKLGIPSLLARVLLRSLMRIGLVVNMAPEHANHRFFNYYSKNYKHVKEQKLKEQQSKSFGILRLNLTENFNDSQKSVVISQCDSDGQNASSYGENSINEAHIKNSTNKKSSSKRKYLDQNDILNQMKKLKMSRKSSIEKSEKNNIIELKCDSIYMMRRVNIVLEHVYKNEVELQMNLKWVVMKEEQKQGFSQGEIDRKSVNNAIGLLANCGKVKLITLNVSNPILNKSKDITFVAMPNINQGYVTAKNLKIQSLKSEIISFHMINFSDHPFIQAKIRETKDNLAILYVKHANQKRRKEMDLDNLITVDLRTSNHGYAPKFMRMKVLHELLSYLLLFYEGDENLDREECTSYLRKACKELDENEQLPQCYVKEVSWKTFIPPLMKYEEYSGNWVSHSDVAERTPLRVLFMLIRLRHELPRLDEYLRHPIKQNYLIRNLPVNMQKIIRVDKRYLQMLNLTFRNLAVIGLVQFGPRANFRGNMNLIYLNSKTQLLDTRSAPAAYSKITLWQRNYPKHYYSFSVPSAIDIYWRDAMRFSLGTKLGSTKRKPSDYNKEKIAERLKQVFQSHTLAEAPLNDNGFIPGDNLGACGFDSSMFSHLVRSWFFNSKKICSRKFQIPQPSKSCVTKHSKLMTEMANRKTITKLKKFRFISENKSKKKKKKPQKLTYDVNDIEALKKLKTMRSQWTKAEDDFLIMAKLAASYSAAYFGEYNSARHICRLLHSICSKSADKTALACKTRFQRLIKDKIREHAFNVSVQELNQDTNLLEVCRAHVQEVQGIVEKKEIQNINASLDRLTTCVFRYLIEKSNVTTIRKQSTVPMLPDSLELFKKLSDYKYPNVERDKCMLIQTDSDIRVLAIVNLIVSTLLSQVDRNKMLNITYLCRVFENFDEACRKQALAYIRLNRLISYNKKTERSHSSYLPIGHGVYHFSLTWHMIFKTIYSSEILSQIYQRYLHLNTNQACRSIHVSSYDAGLSVLFMTFFTSNQITFDVEIPKNILVFDAKPVPLIDPKSITKPMFDVKNEYVDETILLIKEAFFDDENAKKKRISNTFLPVLENGSATNSDSESEVEYEKCDLINEGEYSNISVLITRRQFKQSDARFSNAYDQFLINVFSVKYDVYNVNPTEIIVSDAERSNCLKSIEKDFIHTKMKFTNDEIIRKIKEYLPKPEARDLAIAVLEFLKERGIYGVTNSVLKDEFADLFLLRMTIDALCKSKLVLCCGSKYTHYIHIEFATSWLIPCQKSAELFIENDGSPDSPQVLTKYKCEKMEVQFNEDRVWMNVKPWGHLNGSLNQDALVSFLIRILSYIIKRPGVSLKQVQDKFIPALQPHHVCELVRILEDLKCVQRNILVRSYEVDLFSELPEYSIDEKATGFENESVSLLEPDVAAMFRFSTFVAKVDYYDLLERTKDTLDETSANQEPCSCDGLDEERA